MRRERAGVNREKYIENTVHEQIISNIAVNILFGAILKKKGFFQLSA
jgi:hypothetical protein